VSQFSKMKLSLFWKLMLSFALVVAVGLSVVVLVANQVTNRELHEFMMDTDSDATSASPGFGMMNGQAMPRLRQPVIDRVNSAIIVGGLLALAAALAIGFVIFRSITRPIDQLTIAAQSLAHGNLSTRVQVDNHPARLGTDEISDLGSAFNMMADNLEQAEQLRRDLTADVAHELRTPLSVIRANLEAMIDGVYPADTDHIHTTLDQVNLLSRLIEDLRTLALAEAGQLQLVKRPADVAKLISSSLASFETQAQAQQIDLRFNVQPNLPAIEIDPDRLQQAIAILIANALRYTPAHGSIAVNAQHANDRLQIEVIDTGAGIPPEDLPHVFERFYRADKSRSRAGGGSGLGLAIAKSIIEAHAGTIEAQSELGHGTTMKVQLPFDDKLQAASGK
jgi:signal transduction histidine kinase